MGVIKPKPDRVRSAPERYRIQKVSDPETTWREASSCSKARQVSGQVDAWRIKTAQAKRHKGVSESRPTEGWWTKTTQPKDKGISSEDSGVQPLSVNLTNLCVQRLN